jgi:undecaprenyl diphosphate synthase
MVASNKPRHVGIIMDGNGRWAEQRGRARTFGHIKGARIAKKIVTAAAEIKIEHLTLYAFSTENWLRPEQEVTFLMRLLSRYLSKETANLVKENIRFSVIGDLNRLPSHLREAAQQTVRATNSCTGMNLIFALSYGSRAEITDTARYLAEQVKSGELDPSQIDESLFDRHLSTYPSPSVDLIIRTSGEQRISNFMLWQAAYSELYFTKTLWPDFSRAEFTDIIDLFSSRERRFGKVSAQHEQPRY